MMSLQASPYTFLAPTLTSIEALSGTFEWDGKIWNDTDDDHWVGENWKPVKTECETIYGFEPYQVVVKGHKVTCN